MSKAIAEIGIGAGLIAFDFLAPEIGIALTPQLSSFLIGTGSAMAMSGLGTLLEGNPSAGISAASRNPIKPWDVIYGRAKVGGTIVYLEENGDDDKYLYMVFVLACHQCKSVDHLLLDDQIVLLDGNGNSYTPTQQQINISTIKRDNGVVYVTLSSAMTEMYDGQQLQIANVSDTTFNGTFQITADSDNMGFSYICGGDDKTTSGGYAKTLFPDYADKIHMETVLGNHTSTFPGLLNDSSGLWTSEHMLYGRTAVYLKFHYNDSIFANGLPNISFLVHGKNTIFDPRTSTYGYSENPALCIADYLNNSVYGFDCTYGTEIPTTDLISAANICDESIDLANGNTESRYTCNGTFTTASKRGEVLENLLTSCGGRLTYSGGEFVVHPAAWTGATTTIGESGTTDSSQVSKNMLINSQGLVVNSYNDTEGRGEYFPGVCGTSEGQFLMACGLLDAYQATKNVTALSLATKVMSPIVDLLYRGAYPPVSVTQSNAWAPHWLYTVKGPATACKIHYNKSFAFTNGVASIPDEGFTMSISSSAPSIATTGVHVQTWTAPSSTFTLSGASMLSEQDVSSLMFNAHPQSIFPGDPHESGNQADPMVCNNVDSEGEYAGDTPISYGTGQFQLDLTGSIFIKAAGTYTFTAYVNSFYVMGIDGATYVSGDLYTGGITTTPNKSYTVVGAMQDATAWAAEKQGAWGALSTFTVSFPAAGLYPFEIGYRSGVYSEKQFCLLANGSVIPLASESDLVSITENGKVHNVFQCVSDAYTLLWDNPYSALTSGRVYPIASSVYDSTKNATIVTLTDTTVSATLTIIYSTEDGATIPVNTDMEAWPDWRALDDGEIDCAIDSLNWAYRAYKEATSSMGDPLWRTAAAATLQQMALSYAVDDARDWIPVSWSGSAFSDGARFKYSARASAPTFTCDSYGDVLIDIPADSAGGEVQYGEASVGDAYASTDSTEITVGSTIAQTLQVYIDTASQSTYNAANRYFASITLPAGGTATYTLTLASFVNASGTALAAASSVYSVGITDTAVEEHTLTLTRIRQLPDVAQTYAAGSVLPFTSNFSDGVQVSWRGPYYTGYQSPWAIKQIGNETLTADNIQFLADAQTEYASVTGQGTGPFAPVYIPNRKDAVTYGAANTWTWSGPDPNTKWGGYQYRPLRELALLVNACSGSESYYTQAVTVEDNFLSWMDSKWTSGKPFTDYVSGVPQANYDDPHAAALILHAVLLMDQAKRPNANASGTISSTYSSLISKCITYLTSLYNTSGVMAGTFCADVTDESWYGFWHGELMRAISLLLTWAISVNDTATASTALTWLNGLIAFVGGASVGGISIDNGADTSTALARVTGPVRWKPKASIHQLYNGVKGVYICPSNKWEESDFPAYAQDEDHGYSNGASEYEYDENLTEDQGNRIWKDIQLPFTISCPTAQRLAKIELMRIRQQGTGTFAFDMSMYKTTALDVVAFTLPLFGWTQKLLEVTNHRLTVSQQNGVNLLGIELDLKETSDEIFEWSATEELTPQGYKQAVLPDTTSPLAPGDLMLESGSDTVITTASGVKMNRVKITWDAPTDGYVLEGGSYQLQWKLSTDTGWTGLATCDPSVTQYYLTGVSDGQQVYVRIRSINCAGYPSSWVQAGPETVSNTTSTITSGAVAASISINGTMIGS